MPRGEVMKHLFKKDNIGLICPKQVPDKENSGVYISKFIAGHKTCSAYNINNLFPLYLYPETTAQQTIEQTTERQPNLNVEIVNQIAEKLNLKFVAEKFPSTGGVAESRGGKENARNTKNYMALPYNPKLKQRARELRQAGYLSEVLFWNQVKTSNSRVLILIAKKL